MKIAIFASGNGSNFEAIIKNTLLRDKGLSISIMVCDKPEANVIKLAEKYKISVFINQLENYPDRSSYEEAIIKLLKPYDIDYIILAGYMRVVTSTLLSEYPRRIINIHPSYLPAYSGLRAIERAFEANEEETGVTIHYIDEDVDTGPLIQQKKVPIYKNDTLPILEKRVHSVEHELYSEVLAKLLDQYNKGEQL
ncbi:phosphoribosylglycinamide formyltransferase [Companilactobacillus metriopterae]|uniref:phosphoribosylglycinamide formyltransferase n=1 Tax=Companilactobacillus metriopterae TaxID=1909267 RepID=UPI00100AB901|nr:phosphoribosylglycinamide formyltransferase [Companilactobacillus metriopterae]